MCDQLLDLCPLLPPFQSARQQKQTPELLHTRARPYRCRKTGAVAQPQLHLPDEACISGHALPNSELATLPPSLFPRLAPTQTCPPLPPSRPDGAPASALASAYASLTPCACSSCSFSRGVRLSLGTEGLLLLHTHTHARGVGVQEVCMQVHGCVRVRVCMWARMSAQTHAPLCSTICTEPWRAGGRAWQPAPGSGPHGAEAAHGQRMPALWWVACIPCRPPK